MTLKRNCMIFALLALWGCASLSPVARTTLYYTAGYKATAEAVQHHPGNREAAAFIADTIETALAEEEIAYAAIEVWYRRERERLALDPIDRELLEMLVIKPLYENLKRKYGGVKLRMDNPDVRDAVEAFVSGVRAALATH